jgi:HD-GYP domain-containing protein (c-di-GMP phosphodiesterase class II)
MKTEKNIFLPIDLSVLRIDEVNPFNFYLKTEPSNNEYVLYSKKGSRFTEELRLELISNGVKIIYIPDADHVTYLEYVEWNLQNIVNDKSISAEEKSKLVYNSSKHLFSKLFQEPRIETILRTKKVINHLVDIIVSDQKTTEYLIRITEHDYATYTHSINIGILSLAFAKSILKDVSKKEFYNLRSGFFLHDIGTSGNPSGYS